jgi:glyoxylase I family protein
VRNSEQLEDQVAIDIRGIAPLLSVFDMPNSLKFYCETLGFEVAATDGKPAPQFDWVMLRLNGSELMLNTAYDADERPPSPDPARIAAHRDVVIYFGCPDVDGAYAHLQEMGLDTKKPKIASYGMKQLYVTDPDGYLLCFQWQAEGPRAH